MSNAFNEYDGLLPFKVFALILIIVMYIIEMMIVC